MAFYNMMTCEGPDWTMSVLGGCSQAWFIFVIVLLLVLMLRRQCNDGILSGTAFSFYGALILGLGGAVALTTITGSPRWSLLAGLVGIAIGGFVLGMFTGADSSGGDDYE